MLRRSLSIPLLIAILVVLVDQASKLLIIENFFEGQSVSIIGDLLYFQFIFNEGGAMGTRIGPSWIYTILTIVALILIVRYLLFDKSENMTTAVALSLISGGAVGNLIDRIRFGKVVDFIDMDFPDIEFLNLYRWFTFNIADAAISVGLVIFIINLIIIDRRKNDSESPTEIEEIPEIKGDDQ
ncbi:MAG: signal peptidase II [candidate division Zixibacteria bacterium]